MTELRERPGDQQLPVPNQHPAIADLVRDDIEQRRQIGIARYGTPLQPHNGRDALRDLYEELLDGACYIRQAIYERDNGSSQKDHDADSRPGHGPGVPGAMHLEAFGQAIADAFGHCPYHVGSSATSKTWRDVDVRLILDDDRFHALFPGFASAHHVDAWWSLFCAAMSELGRARTGLPVDFQVQSMTEANEKHHGIRNPLMLLRARDEHRPTIKEAHRA